jgi:hypothetical protein
MVERVPPSRVREKAEDGRQREVEFVDIGCDRVRRVGSHVDSILGRRGSTRLVSRSAFGEVRITPLRESI